MKRILLLLSFFIPVIISGWAVISGTMPFWYDPARDLLLGLHNLQKISLIGPPSGIPGIFYGPYWIWLLSAGLLFSHDPRIVVFLTAFLPYFTLFSLIVWRLSKHFGWIPVVLAYLFFMLSYGGYTTQLWNPYPAPLLIFLTIFVISSLPSGFDIRKLLQVILSGILAGLTLNFHISFGIGMTLGIVLYFLLQHIMEILRVRGRKRSEIGKSFVITLVLFSCGFLLTFLPFLGFEIRHGFQQTHVVLRTVLSPFAVVGIIGLSDKQILAFSINRFSDLLQIPMIFSEIVLLSGVIILIYKKVRKNITFTDYENSLILLICTIFCSVLTVYLLSKNPVWDYHFIGFEILYLFFLIIMIKKSPIFRILGIVWVLFVLLHALFTFGKDFSTGLNSYTSLKDKQYITDIIFTDTGKHQFTVAAYNPAIYTYDFDYLFQWRSKEQNHIPPVSSEKSDVTYVIFPAKVEQSKKLDFLHYKTPENRYKTVNIWNIPDGEVIMKRVKTQ